MADPAVCGRGLTAGFFALLLCGCGVQQVLDAEPLRPDADMAHFGGANICRLAGANISATARMGLDRWFRRVT